MIKPKWINTKRERKIKKQTFKHLLTHSKWIMAISLYKNCGNITRGRLVPAISVFFFLCAFIQCWFDLIGFIRFYCCLHLVWRFTLVSETAFFISLKALWCSLGDTINSLKTDIFNWNADSLVLCKKWTRKSFYLQKKELAHTWTHICKNPLKLVMRRASAEFWTFGFNSKSVLFSVQKIW